MLKLISNIIVGVVSLAIALTAILIITLMSAGWLWLVLNTLAFLGG